jgi:nucleoside diphosphate kinase
VAIELTYALITPYSLLKSRTGGVIARLLSLCNLDLVAARLYAPSDAFAEAYADSFQEEEMPDKLRRLVSQYIRDTFRKNNRFGISNRCLALLFEGENAVRHLHDDVVGPISSDVRGNTVRGTYGDLVMSQQGEVVFFEPSVLVPATAPVARKQLRLLADYARRDGGILTDVLAFPQGARAETTLVIIKPDNFWRRSSVPGNIIDSFSRTGLYVVASKVLHMTAKQAEEFYRPVRETFVERLSPQLEEKLRAVLKENLEFAAPDEAVKSLALCLREANAEYEFRKIVNYMVGVDGDLSSRGRGKKGKCLALLYQGVDAINKIRAQLGATNPLKADEGTVRSIYGQDLMKNGAHASDSLENAERERRISGLWEEKGSSDFENIIRAYLDAGASARDG